LETALLQNLITGTESGTEFIGGLVIVILYATIGLLGVAGSIFIFRRMFQGGWELIFWASFLIVIAAFYLGFSAYFDVPTHAWQTEVIGVGIFIACAVVGLFYRPAIAVGYFLHGTWDLTHSFSGSSLSGLSLTAIPLGYGVFCATFDWTVGCYLMRSDATWHDPGKFNLYFWRHKF